MTEPEANRPADTEDRLLDHDYDGILEYDNPMPRWWLATFWVTIIFSLIYVLNVPGVGTGKGRIADYESEMAKAAELAAATNPLAGMTAEKLAAIAGDPAQLALGKATFATSCAACHAADGGGGIGPNLTDAYWIHGGFPMEMLATIVNGVLDKGMPAWGKVLKPDQVQAVTAYLTTLVGTTPAKPKEPQGTMAPPAPAAPPTG
jgi:cytochrome c oxidase cbb3-type subunit 3